MNIPKNLIGVVIGVDGPEKHPNKLNYAVSDAKNVYDSFRRRYPVNNVNELYNEQATRENIFQTLDKIKAECKEIQESVRVVIYLSGHGGYVVDENGKCKYCFVTYDYFGKKDNAQKEEGLLFLSTIADFYKKIRGENNDKEIEALLIIDSCYRQFNLAGAAGANAKCRALQIENGNSVTHAAAATIPYQEIFGNHVYILAACGIDDAAFESKKEGGGLFTRCFLDALSPKKEPANTLINKDDLIEHIKTNLTTKLKAISVSVENKDIPVEININANLQIPLIPPVADQISPMIKIEYEQNEYLPVPVPYTETPMYNLVKERINNNEKKILWVSGERFTGKTTAVAKAIQDLSENGQKYIWVNCNERLRLDIVIQLIAYVAHTNPLCLKNNLYEEIKYFTNIATADLLIPKVIEALDSMRIILVLDYAVEDWGTAYIPNTKEIVHFLKEFSTKSDGNSKTVVICRESLPKDLVTIDNSIATITSRISNDVEFIDAFNVRRKIAIAFCKLYNFLDKNNIQISSIEIADLSAIIKIAYAKLTDSERKALEIISVYNGQREQDLIEEWAVILPMNLSTLEESFNGLAALGLIWKDRDGYFFIHRKIREIVAEYVKKEPDKDKKWHTAAAEYYRGKYKDGKIIYVGEIWSHYAEIKEYTRMILFLMGELSNLMDQGHIEAINEWIEYLYNKVKVLEGNEISDQNKIDLLDIMCKLARHESDYKKIDKFCVEAQNIVEKITKSDKGKYQAKIYFRKAEANIIKHKLKDALEQLERAEEACNGIADVDFACDILNRKTHIYERIPKYRMAMNYIRKWKEIVINARKADEWKDRQNTKIYSREVSLLTLLGKHNKVRPMAVDIFWLNSLKKPIDPFGVAIAFCFLSKAAIEDNKWENAKYFADQALLCLSMRRINEIKWFVIATVCLIRSRLENGESLNEIDTHRIKLLGWLIKYRPEDQWRILEVRELEAEITNKRDGQAGAIKKYEEILKEIINNGEPYPVYFMAKIKYNIGKLNGELLNYKEAINWFKETLCIAMRNEIPYLAGNALFEMGKTYEKMQGKENVGCAYLCAVYAFSVFAQNNLKYEAALGLISKLNSEIEQNKIDLADSKLAMLNFMIDRRKSSRYPVSWRAELMEMRLNDNKVETIDDKELKLIDISYHGLCCFSNMDSFPQEMKEIIIKKKETGFTPENGMCRITINTPDPNKKVTQDYYINRVFKLKEDTGWKYILGLENVRPDNGMSQLAEWMPECKLNEKCSFANN